MSERLERFSIPLVDGSGTADVELVTSAAGGGGATLLCLHGFGDNLHTWQAVTSMLAPLDVRVIAPDLPGFGRSQLPRGFARSYLWNGIALASAMTARWREPGVPLFVMGNSLGGAIALGLAAREARAGRPLDGLLLLSPATRATRLPVFAHLARAPFYRWSDGVQRRLPGRARHTLGILVARATIRLILAPGSSAPPAWRDSVVESFSRPGCLGDVGRIARNVLWMLRGKDAEVAALYDELRRVSTPTVVLHGDLDRVVQRDEMVDLRARLSNARLRGLPGVGHCPQIEAPARCVAALQELRGER